MKTKIFNSSQLSRVLALVGLGFLIFLSTVGLLEAQQVTQGYGADKLLERGMIIRLKKDDVTKVEPVSAGEADQMHGIVVDANDAPLTLSSDDEKVFVATAGRFEVLVSTQNGSVKAGDYLTVSSTDGIGMKANKDSPYVVGKALDSFDGSTGVAGDAQVNGRTVKYGRVLTDISVAANPLFRSDNPSLPGFLQRAAEAISGKPVSASRVYLAGFIAAATVIIAGSLLYGGVRSSITAIGRNPLSKVSVVRNMVKVILVGIIIFISGLFAVYLLIKL